MQQGSARLIGFLRERVVFYLSAIAILSFCLDFGVPEISGAIELRRADGDAAGVRIGGVEWLGIDKGLALVRQRYKPALVWFPGSSPRDDLGLVKRLENSTFRRIVEKYVLIRLTPADLKKTYSPRPNGPRVVKAGKNKPPVKVLRPADGPTVSAELRLPPGDPALVILDFRERLLERYDRELPGKDALSSRLKKILKISDYSARQSIPFEKRLLESKEALKLGNKRVAVLKIKDLESPSLRKRMDPVLQSWIAGIIRDYRQAARKALDKAIALEKEGDKLKSDSGLKYTKAIDAFEKISKDYPFKDIMVEANRHSGEILRKMTAFGNNPFSR